MNRGLKMPNTHAQNKQIQRDRKRAQGLVRKEIWCKPSQWPAIQAFCQAKARNDIEGVKK